MAEENEGAQAPGQDDAQGGQAADEGRTFTQDEVNRLIGREKAKYKGYSDLKRKAEAYDRLQEEGRTELERATARAEKAEARLAELSAEKERRRAVDAVARECGVDASLLGMMRGDTENELREAARAVRDALDARGRYPQVRDDGARSGGGATTDRPAAKRGRAQQLVPSGKIEQKWNDFGKKFQLF